MMPYRYIVKIEESDEMGLYCIRWIDFEKGTEEFFDASLFEIMETEFILRKKSEYQLLIGRKLFQFLDGTSRYFSNMLNEALKGSYTPLIYLAACKETENWPFELLAYGEEFIVPTRVHLVRCVSERGAKTKLEPKNRPLKILFMASSAIDVKSELNFEKEEEAIFKITENLAVDMDVEDSGSLDGLKEKLANEHYDIVHLSGHAGIGKDGGSYFIMEDETGYRRDVSPSDLYHEALIENPPQLVFLSGCSTGEAKELDASVSFSRELVEKFDVPFVLGWGSSVNDNDAIIAGKFIYYELSRGKNLLEAVWRARYELVKKTNYDQSAGWLLLRLFGDMTPTAAFVTEEQKKKLIQRHLKHIELKNSHVKVLEEGFVGRRRQLQQSLKAIKNNRNKTGVLILGAGGIGKSCLAGKICERFRSHNLIIVHGELNSISLEEALRGGMLISGDEKGMQVLEDKIELSKKLDKLCVGAFRERNYFIILDDFEQNLEGYEKGETDRLRLEAAQLMKVLLHRLPMSGKMTQLIITSRYRFFLEERGIDLVLDRLELVYLTRFLPAEQEKKVAELGFISKYPDDEIRKKLVEAGYGNPRLMEWLNSLVKEMATSELTELMDKIEGKKEEFIREHVLRELLRKGGKGFSKLVSGMSIYRRPISIEGVKVIGEKAGLLGWEKLLKKGVENSIVEFYRIDGGYGVISILRKEMVGQIEDCIRCHRAAFEYYVRLKEEKIREKLYDPFLVEELIYHALGCGEEEVASSEGGVLVRYLHEKLAYWESKCVGEWILKEKKKALFTENDAILLNNLGYLASSIGDQRKAIKYYEQALAIDEMLYGKMHTDVAIDLNNLGSAYDDLGEKEKAIMYYNQALAIVRNTYGEYHSYVAGSLNNLGSVYDDLGEKEKAIDYYEQALAIDEKVHGKTHPNVAIRLNNLGETFRTLGELQKASEYYKQALGIWKKIYGEEHPNVATSLNNLGSAYDTLGEKEKAIDYFEQALAIDEKVYGIVHPTVARELNNLGSVYNALGEMEKAIRYFEKALVIKEKVYSEGHPSMATTLHNLGSVYLSLGQKDRARPYVEKSYAIRLKYFGKNHTHTKKTKELLTKCR